MFLKKELDKWLRTIPDQFTVPGYTESREKKLYFYQRKNTQFKKLIQT